MRAGGAERVMASLCNQFVEFGYDVTLVTLTGQDENTFFPLDGDVRWMPLDCCHVGDSVSRVRAFVGRLSRLRRAIHAVAPDTVISFLDTMNITVLLATRGLGVPVIVSERVDPLAHRHRIGRFKSALRRITYPWAERVVVQTRRARAFFPHLSNDQVCILPNPIAWPTRTATPDRLGEDNRLRLIGVGRLDPQKGFDLLIDAFALLATDFPGWDLEIFGEGAERLELSRRVAGLGLAQRVWLRGVTAAIEDEYCRAHILAFPSRYEGFPNVLGEAMATCLPAVAFEGVSGVEDLAVSGRTALLAPHGDVRAFAARLARLMANPTLRRQLGEAARERAGDFSPPTIYAQWRRLVDEVGEK